MFTCETERRKVESIICCTISGCRDEGAASAEEETGADAVCTREETPPWYEWLCPVFFAIVAKFILALFRNMAIFFVAEALRLTHVMILWSSLIAKFSDVSIGYYQTM